MVQFLVDHVLCNPCIYMECSCPSYLIRAKSFLSEPLKPALKLVATCETFRSSKKSKQQYYFFFGLNCNNSTNLHQNQKTRKFYYLYILFELTNYLSDKTSQCYRTPIDCKVTLIHDITLKSASFNNQTLFTK